MKKTLHKSASVILAFIVLLSTFSFTIASHYCGEELVSISVFSDSEGCGEEENEVLFDGAVCCNEGDDHCKDVKTAVEGESLKQQALEKVALGKAVFITGLVVTYETLLFDKNAVQPLFYAISELFIHTDFTVLFGNFRI